MAIVGGFARPREIELHAAVERPRFKRFRHELGAVIDGDGDGEAVLYSDAFQGRDHGAAGERKAALQHRTLATPLIDNREHAKRSPVEQLIMHEVHTPPLLQPRRHGGRPPMQRHMLPAPHAHPHLQTFKPIEPAHALSVHEPPLAPQQGVNAIVPEARSRHRDFTNAQPQRRLILRSTRLVPRRPRKAGEPTRPGHGDLERLAHPDHP